MSIFFFRSDAALDEKIDYSRILDFGDDKADNITDDNNNNNTTNNKNIDNNNNNKNNNKYYEDITTDW